MRLKKNVSSNFARQMELMTVGTMPTDLGDRCPKRWPTFQNRSKPFHSRRYSNSFHLFDRDRIQFVHIVQTMLRSYAPLFDIDHEWLDHELAFVQII